MCSAIDIIFTPWCTHGTVTHPELALEIRRIQHECYWALWKVQHSKLWAPRRPRALGQEMKTRVTVTLEEYIQSCTSSYTSFLLYNLCVLISYLPCFPGARKPSGAPQKALVIPERPQERPKMREGWSFKASAALQPCSAQHAAQEPGQPWMRGVCLSPPRCVRKWTGASPFLCHS